MRKSFSVVSLFVALSLSASVALASQPFPSGPDSNMTPGSLCAQPTSYRYPEKIKYCERNVETDTKRSIFRAYDQIGFRTQSMNRGSFKIDHLIPLCAGGSNETDNLWPQHESVYKITDPLEPLVCEKMASGRLKQQEAVKIILAAKKDLSSVRAWIQHVSRL